MPTPEIPHRDSVITPGETAPEFTLSDSCREDWTLGDHVKQGDVVLCFFPFAFTGVCGIEMEYLTKAMDRWKAAGSTCVGISCDSSAALKAWAEQGGFDHTLLSDPHRAACRAYGLFWADQNVAMRGTVIIGQSEDGIGLVKWSQSREPSKGMDFEEIMSQLT